MGLLGVWNINCLELPTLAVLPYDGRLGRFPAYLQQLDMESNGKSVNLAGQPLQHSTAPVIWGEPGNNAQHSFFQMLHQGTPRAALDLLLPAQSSCGNPATGRARDRQLPGAGRGLRVRIFDGAGRPPSSRRASFRPSASNFWRATRSMPGNRPVSVVAFQRLDARTLGSLVALYEHKVFTQSVVWGINAFDQWGVELGKKMCDEVLPLVRDPEGAVGTRAMLKPLLDRLHAVAVLMARAMPRAGVRRSADRAAGVSARRRASADAGWFESGDVVLRNDLLLLNDAEVIRLPVNQWPMPRAMVEFAMANAKTHFATNAAVSAALARVQSRLEPSDTASSRGLTFDSSLTAGEPGAACATSTRSARENAELRRRADLRDRRSRGVLAERHRRRGSRRRRRSARSTGRMPPCSGATGC